MSETKDDACPICGQPLSEDCDHTDYCRDCDRITVWNGEVCAVCGRVWGT
jgi:RNA polymerase subunit RPABC4/transcription elongation factor Spt4